MHLAGIGAALAIALAVAVARGGLAVPRAVNPLEKWQGRNVVIALVLAVAAGALSMLAIVRSDRGLPRPSAALEWVYSPATANNFGNGGAGNDPVNAEAQGRRRHEQRELRHARGRQPPAHESRSWGPVKYK